MKNTSELSDLMVEFLENCPDFKLNPRGIEIINEIADYAEQTNIFKANKERGEFFDGKTAKTIFCTCSTELQMHQRYFIEMQVYFSLCRL